MKNVVKQFLEQTYALYDYKTHVGQHPLDLVLSKLEEYDLSSKKCNVCQKYLKTAPHSKTFSGHPCQRVLREHLFVANKLILMSHGTK
jgi:hypothetical protein